MWVLGLLPSAAVIAVAFTLQAIRIRRYNRETEEYGRRRQAREDHRDSDSDESVGSAAGADGAGTSEDAGGDAGSGVVTIVGKDGKPYGASEFTMTSDEADGLRVKEPGPPPKPELPRECQETPILAHRAARLLFEGHGRPFGAVAHDRVSFGVDANARCSNWDDPYYIRMARPGDLKRHGRLVPSLDCSCGFYALPTDLAPTHCHKSYVNLQVELYGRVLVCEKGYRSEFQRVVECQLPACPYCGRKAEVLFVLNNVMVEAVCGIHCQNPWSEPSGHLVRLAVADLDLPVAVTRQGR